MTNKLSEKTGGGLIYKPGMMTFDGTSTSYYSDATVTTSGNKTSGVLRFKCDSFTGNTIGVVVAVRGVLTRIRWNVVVGSSDYAADADIQDRIYVQVNNSANVAICKLVSNVDVCDGLEHMLFFAFDADLGTAVFIVDGNVADNTGWTNRVAPTTGTLDAGAGEATISAVNITTHNFNFPGSVGSFGYDDSYVTNWSDFMDSTGNPKKLDESTWTEWGSQPLFWNPHGSMTDNRGSAGAMTENGTIVPAFEENEYPTLGLPTTGTATAADILSGKTAWVDGVELLGSLAPAASLGARTVLFWNLMDLPLGVLSGTEEPQYMAAGVSVTGISSNLQMYSSGVSPNNTSSGSIALAMPAVSGDFRRYIMTFSLNEAGALNTYLEFRFNYTDSSNYWMYRMIDQTGDWISLLYQYIAAVQTERDRSTINVNIENCTVSVILEDHGDELSIIESWAETGGTYEINQYGQTWYAASRPLKSATGCLFAWALQDLADLCHLQTFIVQDVSY